MVLFVMHKVWILLCLLWHCEIEIEPAQLYKQNIFYCHIM